MLQNTGFFVLLLGVLVFVHELGHFLVAKWCGVKVLKFSIGFGPRIFSFTHGETEYQLALLPLGGYVKMAGDSPHDELSPEDAHRGFLAQAPWKRSAIVLAGPAFNLIFPILAYFFVFLGDSQSLAARVGSVEPGLPAAEAGLRPGDRILSIDGEKVRTFEEMRNTLQPRFGQPIDLRVEREGQVITARLTPARTMENTPLEKSVPRGMIGISPYAKPPVVGVPVGSAAEQAGLKSFDRILTVNGTAVADEVALRAALEKLPAEGVLALTVQRMQPIPVGAVEGQSPSVHSVQVPRQTGEGYAALGAEPSDLYVAKVVPNSPAAKAGLQAGDRLRSLDGRELKSFLLFSLALGDLAEKPFQLGWLSQGAERTATVRQEKREQPDELGQKSAQLDLGVRPRQASTAELSEPEKVTLHMGPVEAMGQSLQIVPKIVGQMVKVLGGLFVGSVPVSTIGGPVMLYQLAGKSAEQGLDSFLNLMAVISINLGVVNLLPIPVLDGFHLLAALWEGVRRRPIPVRAREVANMVGLAMLILLMVVAFTNDITR